MKRRALTGQSRCDLVAEEPQQPQEAQAAEPPRDPRPGCDFITKVLPSLLPVRIVTLCT